MDKIAYKYDSDFKFSGIETIQESPLEPGVWLWPPNVTETKPELPSEDMICFFANGTWIYESPIPDPANEQPEVDPRENMIVSSFQAKAALLSAGLLDDVESYFSGDTATSIQKLAWKETTNFYRLSALVISTGILLGLTDDDLDNLFAAASEIII